MGQIGHPYSSQAKASAKRRLARLGGKPGKAWGKLAVYTKDNSYPSTHAGTERPLTIPGKTARHRPDQPGKFARGGKVKGHHTTNIVISHPPGQGASAPGPAAMPPPVGGAGAGVPLRPPPLPPAAPAGGLPPTLPAGARPPVMPPRPPMMPPGARPPGMAQGGLAGPSYHHWGEGYKHGGHVKKAKGGFLKDPPGHTYAGYPHSPTTGVDDAVSPTKRGGAVHKKGYKRGGKVESAKQELEESAAHEAAESKTFERAEHKKMRRGGAVHSDVAEDKKLIASELAKHEKKEMAVEGKLRHRKKGGFVPSKQNSKDPGLIRGIHHNEGVGYRKHGGHIPQLTTAGSGSGKGRLQKSAMAAKVPAHTEG